MRCSRLNHNLSGSPPSCICSTAAKQFVFHSSKCCKSSHSMYCVYIGLCECLRARKSSDTVCTLIKAYHAAGMFPSLLLQSIKEYMCLTWMCLADDAMSGVMRPAGMHASNIHTWMHAQNRLKHTVRGHYLYSNQVYILKEINNPTGTYSTNYTRVDHKHINMTGW